MAKAAFPPDRAGHPRPEARETSPAGAKASSTPVTTVTGAGILLLALVGFTRVVAFAGLHPKADQERQLVQEAARQALDELRGARFEDVYALYNEDPFDDPAGTDTAPGDRIRVPGLGPTPEDATAPIGRVIFPTVFDFDAGLQLREDVFDPSLGMPRDLNADGRVDHRNHAGDYALLPVRVRFEWTGAAGRSVFETTALLGDH